jgi:hypothetical protein
MERLRAAAAAEAHHRQLAALMGRLAQQPIPLAQPVDVSGLVAGGDQSTAQLAERLELAGFASECCRHGLVETRHARLDRADAHLRQPEPPKGGDLEVGIAQSPGDLESRLRMTAGLQRVAGPLAAYEFETSVVGALWKLFQQSRSARQPPACCRRVTESGLMFVSDPQTHVRCRGILAAAAISGVGVRPLRDRLSGAVCPPQRASETLASGRILLLVQGGLEGRAGGRPVT